MRKLTLLSSAAALLAGCCNECRLAENAAVSPDGRNEIRIFANPLAYEVLRDGVVVVAKTGIGMEVDGKCLAKGRSWKGVESARREGFEITPIYKKDRISLAADERFFDFGDFGVRLVARDDGVAYRFETKLAGEITVNREQASLTVPDAAAKCWSVKTGAFGCEECIPASGRVGGLVSAPGGKDHFYLPFAYAVGGKYVAVTESDVRDYPIWDLVKTNAVAAGPARFDAIMEGWPKRTQRVGGWGKVLVEEGGRWVRIEEHEDYLVKCGGSRTFPWRVFVLADSPAKFCEADIVRALATPAAEGSDFSWVKPGKVAWDWWNCFDNSPEGSPNGGCTTKTYERFIDFAAKTGVEYVIFDEGWSEELNVWKFHPEVDVPHLIDYAAKRNVGIVLWMAWAQLYGAEEKVAEHFAKLGVKGFKIDFMDRGDAEVANFLERCAAACAKHRLFVDYHGAYRPVGMQRMYPNILNYEGIHGLECLKWLPKGAQAERDQLFDDVAACFLRLTAGPMDYTPGAMLNWAVGAGYAERRERHRPGSVGTRCRQMAMMALYEAPFQMLCDSPTNYERNMESFTFMAATPVVWKSTVGLGGCPDCYAAFAREAYDGSWYAAAINTAEARDVEFKCDFLKSGEWTAEIFRDADDCDREGSHYVRETKAVAAGAGLRFHLAPGGGVVVKFVRR